MDDRMSREGGFVAGTLVHTDKGLVPIEQIQVGDMVLSKPEDGMGEGAYKPVVNIFEFEDKEVWFISVTNCYFHDFLGVQENNQFVSGCFISTPNSPFWVVGHLDYASYDPDSSRIDISFSCSGGRWSRLDQIRVGTVLLLVNGTYVHVDSIQPLLQMRDENRGFIQGYMSESWDEEGDGQFVEFVDGGFVPYLKFADKLFNDYGLNAPVKQCKVYKFEVANCHAFFIGESGVLVHNASITTIKIQ